MKLVILLVFALPTILAVLLFVYGYSQAYKAEQEEKHKADVKIKLAMIEKKLEKTFNKNI